MGCAGCTTSTNKDGSPSGCGSKGNCGSGGCNRLNTYDWLSTMEIKDVDDYDVVEVSFKNGARKAFFHNPTRVGAITGDQVVVDTGTGWDVGNITLSGELVRLQIKKKRVKANAIGNDILRIANDRDRERLSEARAIENHTMVRARAIARSLDIEMKIGDVEFQADKRKATFFYTADGRVDFRELIRHYAKEFKVKIEMRQIGARQETARLGGIGSCGRELCCSTWLTDFKSVNTSAARYQNLAINQAKLSGMCGRLKCCLNFELDSYLDALDDIPKHADKLRTEACDAVLVKTDIFKKLMYYAVIKDGRRGKVYQLGVDRVNEIIAMNKKGEKPADLMNLEMLALEAQLEEEKVDFESVNNVIELPMEERKKKRRNNRNRRRGNNKGGKGSLKKPDNRNKSDNRNKADNNGKADNRNKGGNSNNKAKPQAKGKSTSNKPTANANNKGGTNEAPKSGKPKNNRNKRRNRPKPKNKKEE